MYILIKYDEWQGNYNKGDISIKYMKAYESLSQLFEDNDYLDFAKVAQRINGEKGRYNEMQSSNSIYHEFILIKEIYYGQKFEFDF